MNVEIRLSGFMLEISFDVFLFKKIFINFDINVVLKLYFDFYFNVLMVLMNICNWLYGWACETLIISNY
ncbi:hypothetical protein C8J95_10219 [Elizabethkingia sp. YR214]|nr:hypothetical protein C8J95_10219 [Elizabethkingia sp. YR214]